MDYEKQAKDFLDKTGTLFKATFFDHAKYFPGDKESRDIYIITLTRKDKTWRFRFGQSIANMGQTPTPYDVLTCLEKYDPGDFEEFCGGYGCNPDSIQDNKLYKAVKKEWNHLQQIFTKEEIEELREIQ